MGVEAKPVNIQSAPVASSHSVSRESSSQARLEAIDSYLFNLKVQLEPARRLIARLSGVSTMRDVCTYSRQMVAIPCPVSFSLLGCGSIRPHGYIVVRALSRNG